MTAKVSTLNKLRAGRFVRPARLLLGAVAAFAGVPTPLTVAQASPADFVRIESAGQQSIADFYSARSGRPLWLGQGAGQAANLLIDYLRTAEADGLDPNRYGTADLAAAIAGAGNGSPDRVRRADQLLSQAFADYVRDVRRAPAGIIWVDADLKPVPPAPRALLDQAAAAASLEAYVAGMRWMHPVYAGLRKAIVNGGDGVTDRRLLRLNLERARALPAGQGRHILVNATAARLAMYEDGEIIDSMRVVVGKPKNPTPMMAAYIRFTSLNPYWYVPPDLAAERIAPNVVKDGLSYLQAHGYQVMTNWFDPSSIVDPATIDWQAVADGSRKVWIRQLPGPGNSMGQMKFMFPNAEGVYLHDTPQKELLAEASRLFSGGCVRLEDAPRLARWLYGKPIEATSDAPEQRVDLPQPVPVYLTYLTVIPSGPELAVYPDVYGRDRDGLVQIDRDIQAGL